jgi:hypothetical protein
VRAVVGRVGGLTVSRCRGCACAQLYATYRFTFDHVYDQDSRQEEVYETSARSAVHNTLQGYNAAIVAYGQVRSGPG